MPYRRKLIEVALPNEPGFRPISVPYTQPVKSYVVREVIKIIRNFVDPEDE